MADAELVGVLRGAQQFLQRLEFAQGPEDITRELVRATSAHGVERVIATLVPARELSSEEQLGHVLFHDYPVEWLARYAAHKYVGQDPAMAQVQRRPEGFLWSDLPVAPRAGRRVLGEACEFGLKQGFTGAMSTLGGRAVVYSLAGRDLELSARVCGLLPLLGMAAIARAAALKGLQPGPGGARLSGRELEALRWASEGKSDWEIGVLMRISEHGVDKHLRAVRRKLGVSTRAHAVAEALRRRLIQ